MISLTYRCNDCRGSGYILEIECGNCDGTGFLSQSQINQLAKIELAKVKKENAIMKNKLDIIKKVLEEK